MCRVFCLLECLLTTVPAGIKEGAGYPGTGVSVVVNLSLLEGQPVLFSAEP